jgi:MarR family 2-MHQ and catechol resistance regulon transcriptional repressor
MTSLDRKAADLRQLVQDIVIQFQSLNAAIANGPHVELNMQELRVIELLGTEGPRMMREIAEFLKVAVNSVTSIVDHLEQKELVRRQRSDEDRRVVRVELTDAGEAMYHSMTDVNLRFLRSMLRSLTDDEQEVFMDLFRKIASAGRTQVQKIGAST